LHKARPSTAVYYKTCTKRVQVLLVLQSLHKVLPSATLYYKARTKHLPVLLCTTKFAKSTSQYYFVLQSLHKLLPSSLQSLQKVLVSTTLYYRACAKYFPALLCTTELAQTTSQYYCLLQKLANSTSQHYFALQSLQEARSSTTLYYKACTKHFPVLLCTAKLAQSPYQYYFVLQSLHAALRSTTLYYKACTKHVPVLLCTAKVAQSTSHFYFVHYKACTASNGLHLSLLDPQGFPAVKEKNHQDRKN